MDHSKYSTYTIKNFLEDDDFIKWVVAPTQEINLFWEDVIRQNPEKLEDIDQAAKLIKSYRKQQVLDGGNQQAVFGRISESIALADQNSKKTFRMSPLLRIAAILLLISSLGLAYWIFGQKVIVTTGFAEIRTIVLPDNSVVVLNSNSQLSYYKTWKFHPRQVWIDGEAYFKVKHFNKDSLHIKPSERFVVHGDKVNVQVLGTVFNVKNRHGKVAVALLTGKVQVDYINPVSSSMQHSLMRPGDFVELFHDKLIARKSLKKPADIVLWANHQLIFKNPHLSDIVEKLHDEYGLQVKIGNPDLLKLQIDGEINVPTVGDLLEILNTTLPVICHQNNTTITITKTILNH